MKNKVLLIFAVCILLSSNVFASTKTDKRTESNLQIATDIKVTSENKQVILKTPKVDETEKIYDFADLFTETEENTLYSQVSSFIEAYSLDMAVVTIKDNNKSSAMAYADDFYDYNYFGEGTTNDGLLFLIDMDTREMWISTAGEAQLIYDDVRIEKILDATYSKIKAEKYFECAKEFITYSGTYAKAGIPKSNSNMKIDETGDYVEKATTTESDIPWIQLAIIAFIVSGIIIAIAASMHRTVKKAQSAKSYIVLDSIAITKRRDDFLHTHTSQVRIESSSSGGGGSSTHHSSSGRSHGGGGRSF